MTFFFWKTSPIFFFCFQLLSEAAPDRMRIVHGDILTYRMDRRFPAELSKPWEDGTWVKSDRAESSQTHVDVYILKGMQMFFRPTKPPHHWKPAIQRLNTPHYQVVGKYSQQNRAVHLRTHPADAHLPEGGGRGEWRHSAFCHCV